VQRVDDKDTFLFFLRRKRNFLLNDQWRDTALLEKRSETIGL
jgi:hypothetical protein